MAKRTIIKPIIFLLSLPFYFFAILAEHFDLWNINNDKIKCLTTIEENKNVKLSKNLREILIIAEDRRNAYHKGIDPIAMIRAIVIKITKNQFQGASTIEQQFVRVVSQRYERKLTRKLREQILAIVVLKRTTKKEIADTYLSIAFYGSGKIGAQGMQNILSTLIENASIDDAIPIVSRLKYPEPLKNTANWKLRHDLRNNYIKKNYMHSQQ